MMLSKDLHKTGAHILVIQDPPPQYSQQLHRQGSHQIWFCGVFLELAESDAEV